MRSTGRTAAKRNLTASSAWRAPWNAALGTQTMYCSDCHGSSTGANTVIPTGTNTATGAGNPWGPHGSSNPFILKGTWTKDSGGADAATALCLKCHVTATYTSSSDQGDSSSAFCCGSGDGNLHNFHVNKGTSPMQCTWCHVAVPHGWKNKSLLVNLNDVGEEAGFAAGSSNQVAINGNSNFYTKAPYYLEAKLKIRTFQRPGQWTEGSCGSSQLGVPIVANTQGSTSNLAGGGRDWMRSMCGNPP